MRRPNGYWNKPKNRIRAIKEVMSKKGKPVTHITRKDFIEQGYTTMLSKYKSLFQMLKEAGYDVNPWEMKTIPSHFWDDRGNRINTVLWLMRKIGKPAHEITLKDFVNNGLSNLARKVGSHRKALREAGYNVEYHKKKTKPSGYWNKKENRVKAVKEMLEKTGKPPSDITGKDFIRNGLSGLLAKYNQSPSAALKDTGYGVNPLKRKYLPTGYWNKKENRAKPVRDMVKKLNKPLRDITRKDFRDAGLWRLFTYRYNNSIWRALNDAGYTIERTQMRRKPHGYWNEKENRVNAIKEMFEKIGKDPSDVTGKDFIRSGLTRLLVRCNGSPSAVLEDAGYEVKRLKRKLPSGYWNKKENRIKAIKEVMSKTGKPATHLTRKDFIHYGYATLLWKYKTMFQMVKEAGYNVNPWEMKTISPHFWDDKENRIHAVIWLVRKLKKPAYEVTMIDFVNNGLSNLVRTVGSHRKALREAGYNVECYDRKNAKPSGYWNKKENIVKAVKEMLEKTGKSPSDIIGKDFRDSGLTGVLVKYNGSPGAALEDAGYRVEPLKRKYIPHGYWNKKENRVKVIRDMVEKLNKPMKNITYKDFKDFRLLGLLTSRYNKSPWKALKDAGYTIGRTQLHTKPGHYWDKKERGIKAVRKMVEKTGKDPMEITTKDFMEHNLGGMLYSKYNGSPFYALKEAGLVSNEWEMRYSPRCWHKKENRIKAVKWLVEKTGKNPSDITVSDFNSHGIYGLVKWTKSHKKALKEAGYNVEIKTIKSLPHGYWGKKENRVNAVKEFVKKLDKKPGEITKQDFLDNSLTGLLDRYADEKCKSFSKGEIFTFDEGYLLEYKGRVTRALKEAEIL